MGFKHLIILLVSGILYAGCASKKELRYKETIATIEDEHGTGTTNPLLVTLVTGSAVNTNNGTWSNYSFWMNGQKYWGEGYSGYCIGEKFVVRYDTTKFDNDHSYLLYYKPVFMNWEQTKTTTGKITKVYGKDLLNKGAVAATFEYDLLLKQQDTVKTHFQKYQYFPPGTNVDSLKQHPDREYRVLYSIDNPQRSILYLDAKKTKGKKAAK